MSTPARIQHPAPHRERFGFGWLLFGIFAAPFAWTLQLMVGSAVAGHACFPGDRPLDTSMWADPRGILLVTDAAGILLAAVALLVSAAAWARVHKEREGSSHRLLDIGEGRTRFMAMAGILSSSLFLLALLSASTQVFVFRLCL
ncbi:MAG TPA: hypothetical protein VF651_00455 [Gammaproteobacteria bacterium]